MKGYFSQLAYRTGLSFEARGPRAAGNAATGAPAAAMREGSAKVEPLHTEEISVMTPLGTPSNLTERGNESSGSLASPGAMSSTENESLSLSRLAGMTNEANSQPSELSNAKPEAARASSSATEFPTQIVFEESHIRFTDSESKTAKPREQAAEKQSDLSGHEVVLFSDEVSPVAKKSAPPELIERVKKAESSIAASEFGRREFLRNRESRVREAAQEKLQLTNAGEQSAPVLDERMEEELIVQNYLKEVRAWVSATPGMDGSDVEQNNWSEVRQGNRNKFALEQEESLAPFPRRDGAREPEVQDLNLSIGSISIVIEEPRKDVIAPPPAPRKAEVSPTRTGSESTSLSRYYLRSW